MLMIMRILEIIGMRFAILRQKIDHLYA